MSYCSNCGVKVADGVNFCPGCGTRVGTGPVKCINCGVKVSEGVNFCPGCGASVGTGSIKCSNCGAAMSQENRFCPSCGKKVSVVETPEKVSTVETPDLTSIEDRVEKADRPLSLGYASIFIGFALAMVGVWAYYDSDIKTSYSYIVIPNVEVIYPHRGIATPLFVIGGILFLVGIFVAAYYGSEKETLEKKLERRTRGR